MWPIVTTALSEGRHELAVSGPEICQLIEKHGFDNRICDLVSLNFLEISRTTLECLPERISNLKNLGQLCLSTNRLTSIPTSVGSLHSLRYLDLSFNQLEKLPEDVFVNLSNLITVNLSGNQLESLPNVGNLISLQELIVSKNNLSSLPHGVGLLTLLSKLDLSHNRITLISEELCCLANLKFVDLSDNLIRDVPAALGNVKKLHSLNIRNNPLKDNRLRKLAHDEHSTKGLFEYLRRLGDTSLKGKKMRTNSTSSSTEESVRSGAHPDSPKPVSIRVARPSDPENYQVLQNASIKNSPRPYLLACTVHGVRFQSETQFKQFLRVQDDIHKNLGQMRRRATVATHDLNNIVFPLTYKLQKADSVEIHVLDTPESTSGDQFLMQLYRSAESDRKVRKQSKFSSLYRYLEVLHLDSVAARTGFRDVMLPVVMDATGLIISVHPLTNCEKTRLTPSTTDILIEVSGMSLAVCKEIAEAIISWLMENACPNERPSEESSKDPPTFNLHVPPNSLIVRPIRVLDPDSDNPLRCVFPSKQDLFAPKFNTVR